MNDFAAQRRVKNVVNVEANEASDEEVITIGEKSKKKAIFATTER